MTDQRGIFHKFTVTRTDDSFKHRQCEYFVLDLTHDDDARRAAFRYVEFVAESRPQLAEDLTQILWRIEDES